MRYTYRCLSVDTLHYNTLVFYLFDEKMAKFNLHVFIQGKRTKLSTEDEFHCINPYSISLFTLQAEAFHIPTMKLSFSSFLRGDMKGLCSQGNLYFLNEKMKQ